MAKYLIMSAFSSEDYNLLAGTVYDGTELPFSSSQLLEYIELEYIAEYNGGVSNGGGSTTFADLTDKTTADLPTINTPLSTALADKVTGAASSTDNAIARFDGATGKIIQNSSVFITDAGTLEITGSGNTSATNSLLIKNSSNTETLELNDFGDLTLKNSLILSDGVYGIKNNLGANILSTGGGSTNFYSNAGGFNIYNKNGSQILLNVSNAKVVRLVAPDLQLWSDATPSRAVKINNTSNGNRFSFSSYNGSVWSGEQLVVLHTGEIGVNEVAPTAKFDVNGTCRIRGDATFNGQIIDNAGSVGTDGQVLKKVGGQVLWSNP